jgi:hypothetical protein
VFVLLWVPPARAQVQVASLGGLLLVLGQLRQNLDGVINTADAETAARIKQLQISLDGVISELNNVIKNGFDKAQVTETKLFSDLDDVVERTNHELEDKAYLAYLGVNSTLVNVATVLEGIPFVKIKPYLFATNPIRLSPDATDRVVSFYGHFPDIDKSHPAVVEISMQGAATKRVELAKYVGNQLGFQLPPEYLKEGQFVEMLVSIPTKKYYVWHTTEDVRARLYVEKRDAFSFSITAYQENPALWATIQAPGERLENADSNRTSNSQTLTAKDLFATMINDNVKYDMASAVFVGMGHRESASGPPCHCGCSGGTAAFSAWDANTVTFSLAAPSCGFHWCSAFDSCGGGGTSANIWLRPTFRVKRRGVSETAPFKSQNVAAKRRSVTPDLDLGHQWAFLAVVGEFRDKDEYYKRQVTVTKGVPVGNSELWKVQVANDHVHVETR